MADTESISKASSNTCAESCTGQNTFAPLFEIEHGCRSREFKVGPGGKNKLGRGGKGIKRKEGSRELKENKGGKNGEWNNEKQLNKETETKKFKKELLDKRCRSAMEKQAEKTERVDWRRTKKKKRKEKLGDKGGNKYERYL